MKPALKLVPPPAALPPPKRNYAEINARRGYSPVYQTGMRCPGCSKQHFHIGRFLAECAFCGCAIGLEGAVL